MARSNQAGKQNVHKTASGMNVNVQIYDFKQGLVFVVKPAQGQGTSLLWKMLDIALAMERYDGALERLEQKIEIQQLLSH